MKNLKDLISSYRQKRALDLNNKKSKKADGDCQDWLKIYFYGSSLRIFTELETDDDQRENF